MTTTETECRHGMNVEWCSTCRAELGYRPGSDTFEMDCTVRSFTRLTGAEYGEAAEVLKANGFRPGHGAPTQGVTAALTSVGFNVTEYLGEIEDAQSDGGTFLVCGRKGRKAHAWTIRYGQVEDGYRPPFRYQIWRVA